MYGLIVYGIKSPRIFNGFGGGLRKHRKNYIQLGFKIDFYLTESFHMDYNRKDIKLYLPWSYLDPGQFYFLEFFLAQEKSV